MGSSTTFNWVLQITVPQSLKCSQCYPFEKTGNRIFPLNTPIDLIDVNRNAIAKIKIMYFLNKPSQTTGEFEVIKIYSGEEKTILTNYWIENQ